MNGITNRRSSLAAVVWSTASLLLAGLLAGLPPRWAAAGEPVTLTLMAWGDPTEVEARRATLGLFAERHPEIKVEFLHVTGPYLERFQTMLAAGEVPDVVFLGNGDYQQFADHGVLMPLDPFIQRDNLDLSDVIPAALALYNYRGKQWGFPVDFANQQLFYNRTMFNEAGIAEPPSDWSDDSWDWSAFLDAAKRLTRDVNGDGENDVWGFRVKPAFRAWWIWVTANGGEFFNEDGTALALQQQAAVDALQFLADLIHTYEVAPTLARVQQEQGDNIWFNGKIGMETWWPALGQTRQRVSAWDWNVAPHPAGSVTKASSGGGTGHFITAGTKHPEEAWTLLKFLIEYDTVYLWTKIMGIVPPLVSVAHSDAFLSPGQPPENLMVFIEGSAYLRPDPIHPRFIDARTVVVQALNRLWNNQDSAPNILENAANQVRPLLAEVCPCR